MNKNKNIDKVLVVLASYGIVQVLAQDLGIKTGEKQRDLVQSQPFQFFILYSGAYFVTHDYILALVTVSLYYFLKYVYSGGKTSQVCFEEI
jgi:hypothetical protein